MTVSSFCASACNEWQILRSCCWSAMPFMVRLKPTEHYFLETYCLQYIVWIWRQQTYSILYLSLCNNEPLVQHTTHCVCVPSSAFCHHLLTKFGTSSQTHYYVHPVALHFSVHSIYKQWWLFYLAIKILSLFHSNFPFITYLHNNDQLGELFWWIKAAGSHKLNLVNLK